METTALSGQVGKRKRTSGEQCPQIPDRGCDRIVARTHSVAHSETKPHTHAHKHRLNTRSPTKQKTKHEAVQTHTSRPSPIQLTRLKKKHKNKLHKYFLPSLRLLPRSFVALGGVFFKFVFCPVFCRMIWCGVMSSGVRTRVLT